MRRSAHGFRLFGALLLGLAALARPAAGQPTIQVVGGERVIQTRAYGATVAADGCLTSLRIAGQEWLAAGVDLSRGGYLFGAGVLALSDVSQPKKDVVLAKGSGASLRYVFDDESFTVTGKNDGTQPLHFFLVLAATVKAVRGGGGDLERVPVERAYARSTWLAGEGRLEVHGEARQWGPWMGRHQVWDLTLPPGEDRRVTFKAGPSSPAERADLADLTASPPEAALTLTSPRDHQVLQRHAPDRGRALVSGRLKQAAERVEVRVLGKAALGSLPEGWMPLVLAPGGRTFSGVLELGAGGWYTLEARALKAGRPVAEGRVAAFGVGEVFVIAGQSNSTNSGPEPQKVASGQVATFDGTGWRLADDPQPGVHDRSGGGSPWPAFGDALGARLQVPIGVASTGHGGTSVLQWEPAGELFGWMLTRLTQLGPGGLRAVLWHQGESDVGMASEAYHDRLLEVIRASTERAGWEFPWFVAQVSYLNPSKPTTASTRDAQARLWAEGAALEGPDTDLLGGQNRDQGGQGIHFSAQGLKAHGEAWAQKVGTWLDGLLKTPVTTR